MVGRERLRIGCCISGHGFGHATRTIAVLQALEQRLDLALTLVTTAPAHLFAESLTMPFEYHALPVDVGLVQHNALAADLAATLVALEDLRQRADERIGRIAELLRGCRLVLCDIAPLGIAAARRASIASVLIENFTWDWIYQGYVERWPQLAPHIDSLAALFQQADHRIQTRPVCAPAACDLVVDPVSRSLRQPHRVRQRLGIEPGQQMVLITMGGIGDPSFPLEPLLRRPDLVFVLPGRSRVDEFSANLRLLGRKEDWYHPDLAAATDLVVGKLGYSTVAEVYQASTPIAYLDRHGFREYPILAAFVGQHLPSWRIEGQEWRDGRWLDRLQPLLPQRQFRPQPPGGAEQAASWLMGLLQH